MSYSAEAQEKREMAARARRLAGSVTTAQADRERLIRTALQLEREAQELEDQADMGAANADSPPSQRQP